MALYRRVTYRVRGTVAAGVNGPFDLGVNPISYLILHFDGVVAAVTAVGVDRPWTDIVNINVTFNGASVLNLNGEDLRALLVALGWRVPYVVNHSSATNGDVVRVSIPVPFTRRRFWTRELFPATRKGELQITVTMAAEGATFQARNLTLEGVEVLDGEPQRFLKYVSNSRALTAGDPDFSLPVGNDYVGILVRVPAVADAGIGTGTIRTMKLLVDDTEFGIAAARFEAMRDMFEQKGNPLDAFAFAAIPDMAAYAYIDFDPLEDDAYLLPTIGRASVKLRPELDNSGTVRAIPIELVKVETRAAVAGAV